MQLDSLYSKELIKAERVVRAGRLQLSVAARPWQEFFTKDELNEMHEPEYWKEPDRIRTGLHKD
ncbi:MAG: hypothetical protein AB9879_10915 [Methanothrix sp.]